MNETSSMRSIWLCRKSHRAYIRSTYMYCILLLVFVFVCARVGVLREKTQESRGYDIISLNINERKINLFFLHTTSCTLSKTEWICFGNISLFEPY